MLKRLAPHALFVILILAAAAAAQEAVAGRRERGAASLPIQKGHTHDVLEVHWSPDDKLLLTYSAGDAYLNVWEMPEGRLRWGVAAWQLVKEKPDERNALRAFAWSDDG